MMRKEPYALLYYIKDKLFLAEVIFGMRVHARLGRSTFWMVSVSTVAIEKMPAGQ